MKRALRAAVVVSLLALGHEALAVPGPVQPKASGSKGARVESASGAKAAPKKAGRVKKGERWTAAAPDRMVEQAARRAKAGGEGALAALAVLHKLAERASPGLVKRKLDDIGQGKGEVAEQARWLSASLEPMPQRAAPPGLVDRLAILGPFQDTSGRVMQADLSEASPAVWADRATAYSWGVYEVRWRPVVTPVTARGVPLDLYVHPRRESCTYLASRVTLDEAGPVVVHLASSGAVRLLWDGKTVASSEAVHEGAMFDRLGARVEAKAGDHLVAARVCSGALDDAGRVRLRLARPDGEPVKFKASSDLTPFGAPGAPKVFPDGNIRALEAALTRAIGGEATSPEAEAGKASSGPVGAGAGKRGGGAGKGGSAGKGAKGDIGLSAAIVRRLAGADDLRSPRAPGALEAAARDAGATVDELAMAGWVSAFGAGRSGWLNAARDRAAAEGDDETREFAARRLAAARTEAGMHEWAVAALAGAGGDDAEALLLREHVRSQLGGQGYERAALTKLLEHAERARDKTPVAMWDEIARLAAVFDPKLELRARDELARLTPERFDAARVRAAGALDGAAVVQAVRSAFEQGGVVDTSDLGMLVHELQQAGKDANAREILVLATQLAPNIDVLQHALAEALYASKKAEDRAQADRALSRSRDLDPGDAGKRAEVAFRSGAAAQPPLRDERWLVPSEVVLSRAKADPARKGEVADRQVYWTRVVTQHDDRRVSQLIHYGREIVVPPRSQDELYEQVPIEGDDTELLRARVLRAGGEVAYAEEQKSDHGRPMIRWPELRPGDVVEVALRAWTSGPIGRRGDPPFFFLDYGGSVSTHPLLFNEVITDLPRERPLAVDILNGKADRVTNTDEGDRRITHYVWEKPVTMPDEPLAPRASEIFPTLVGSSFATWDEFRQWYNGAVQGFTEPDEQVRALAAELTKGKKTRDEKLRALFEFVADDIRYVNYVSGEWWLPNRPQQLLARRQGDCDDKAILLITLLKSVGIEATEVLIQTRHTAQPSLLLSQKAAVPMFDHGIAYLPARDGHPEMWLDATSPQSRLGPVPSMDARTYALFATEGPARMVPTPKGSPDDYGVEASWVLKMQPGGGVLLEADERHRGDQGFVLRSALRERDARAQWVEQNLVAGWIPQVQVEPEVEFEGDGPRGEARVRFKAKSAALGRMEGADMVVTLSPSTTLTAQLAPLPKRTLPVALPPGFAPGRQGTVVWLVAPEGMKPAALPPGGDEDGGDFGRAKLSIALDPKDPRTVVLTRSVVFDLEKIPVARYEAWRAWLSRVDSLLHRSVRFVPATP